MSDIPDLNRAPAPVPAGPDAVSAHDLAIADIADAYPEEIARSAIKVLQERKHYGWEKYETILHKDDGRPAGQDAEDEAGDLVVYLRNWMDKHPDIAPFLEEAYNSAIFALVVISCARFEMGVPGSMQRRSLRPRPLAETREKNLHSVDKGLAMRGDIPHSAVPIWICGGLQRDEMICIRVLNDGWCSRHGVREVPVSSTLTT